MADEVVGRADYELRAPIDPLKGDIANAESQIKASGDRTEKAFAASSSKWGPIMADGLKAGVKVVGASVASMLAIASKGALELQSIENDYQSETGASAEEAKRAGKVINQVAGENQKSLESVRDAAIAVHNDLGLVGDQADKVLANMVEFARVTKQEPVAAVKAFDDILDAWNLTADDSQAIMDALVVSHQKYGGAVDADQASLAALAPTLQAANMKWQDGLALLDLSKASGLDTATAITGLNHALAKVKSPAELQRLLADISATADPFLRAQKAADLFGQKAGPKLANALAGKSLQDFAINMDDSAGATHRAADALDQGFLPTVRKVVSEASSALRGLGDDWGPFLTGAASVATVLGSLGVDTIVAKLGPKFVAAMKQVGTTGGQALVDATGTATGAVGTIIGNNISNRIENIFGPGQTALGKVWRRIATSPIVAKAASAAGIASGAVYGAAAAVGGKIAELLGPAWDRVTALIRPIVLAAGLQSGITFGTAAAEGAAGTEAIAGFRSAGTTAGKAFGIAAGAAAVVGVAAIANEIDPEVDKLGEDIGQRIRDALNIHIPGFSGIDIGGPDDWPWPLGNKGMPDWARFDGGAGNSPAGQAGERAGDAMVEAFKASVANGAPELASTGEHAGDAMVQAFRDSAKKAAGPLGTEVPADIARAMDWRRLNALTRAQGNRNMEAYAQGIAAARAKPVDAFNTLVELLKHPLTRAKEQSRLLGELTSKELARGLKSHDPEIRDQAIATKQYILDRLTELKTGSGKLTKQQAALVEKGLKSHDPEIRAAAQHIKYLATHPLEQAKNQAYGDGANVSKQFAIGLIDPDAMAKIRENARKAAAAADDFLHGKSPPPKGPLHTIDEGGANVVKAWAKGLTAGGRYAAVAGAGLAAQLRAVLAADPMARSYAVNAGVFGGLSTGFVGPGAGGSTIHHNGGNVTIGDIHLHGVGSDVSPAAAKRFSQQIMDAVGSGIRDQAPRVGLQRRRW